MKKLLKNSFILLVSVILAALLNLLSQYLLVNKMPPSDYSLFSAINGVINTFSFAFGTLSAFYIKKLHEKESNFLDFLFRLWKLFLFSTLIVIAMLYFITNNIVHILLAAVLSLFNFVAPILVALLTVLKQFLLMAFLNVLNAASKLVIILAFNKLTVSLALLALLVSAISGVGVGVVKILELRRFRATGSLSIKTLELLESFIFLALLTSFAFLDTYVAKIVHLPAEYFVDSTFGKFAFYLSGPFLKVSVSEKEKIGENIKHSIPIVATIGVILTLMAVVAKDFLANLLFYNKYSLRYLPHLTIIYTIYAIAYMLWLKHYFLNYKRKTVVVLFLIFFFFLATGLVSTNVQNYLVALSVTYFLLIVAGILQTHL